MGPQRSLQGLCCVTTNCFPYVFIVVKQILPLVVVAETVVVVAVVAYICETILKDKLRTDKEESGNKFTS